MKILNRYILKEHIGPFLFAVFTITFLFIIELVPKIIDHIIDKDLDVGIVLEIVGLNMAWIVALSIPMSVLVATLMAFGRLTSDCEIIAIKASGINLLRILIPLLIVTSILMVGMIQFNDKVLPDLNKRSRLLWGDISAMRPMLAFRSGMFISDIPGYLVLIDKIDHSTSRVEGVSITDVRDHKKPRIIVAEHGFLDVIDNGATLHFSLYDGEIHSLDTENPDNYRRADFNDYNINVSDIASELKRTNSKYRGDREMSIDQMDKKVNLATQALIPTRENLYTGLKSKFLHLFSDTMMFPVSGELTDSAAYIRIRSDIAALLQLTERGCRQIIAQKKVADKFQIEIYKKYSIPAASLAFVLLGAPLAVLSRRGGMGVAIAVSILMFIVYWAFLMGGEDLADRGLISPFWAMWIANILIGCIGLYLMYIVVSEKPILGFLKSKKKALPR